MAFGFGMSLPGGAGSAAGANAGASLVLDFTSGNQTLDPRITFTRSTTATRFNQAGVMVTAAINAPRFDYNPVTLQPNGLLIEEQRTNLLTYSEQLDNAAWVRTGSSVSANGAVAPDGASTADKVVEDVSTGQHGVSQNRTATAATAYAVSFYAKKAERDFAQVTIGSQFNGTTLTVTFNLNTGATNVTSGVGLVTVSCVAVNNGFFRCTVTATSGAAPTSSVIRIGPAQNASTVSYTGDGVSGVYLWGAQFEVGAFPTSYIPTTNAQVTRTADVAVMTGTNFSSWYNATEGTMLAEFLYPVTFSSSPSTAFTIDDGTSTNEMNVRTTTTHTAYAFTASIGGTALVNINNATVGTVAANTVLKGALAYKSGDSIAAGGGVVTTNSSTTFTPGAFTTARIGVNRINASPVSGYIRRIAYYSRRLANSELQSITA